EQAIVLGRRTGVAFLSGQQILDGVPLGVGDFVTSQHERWPRRRCKRPPPWRPSLHRRRCETTSICSTQHRLGETSEAMRTSTVAWTAKTHTGNRDVPRLQQFALVNVNRP